MYCRHPIDAVLGLFTASSKVDCKLDSSGGMPNGGFPLEGTEEDRLLASSILSAGRIYVADRGYLPHAAFRRLRKEDGYPRKRTGYHRPDSRRKIGNCPGRFIGTAFANCSSIVAALRQTFPASSPTAFRLQGLRRLWRQRPEQIREGVRRNILLPLLCSS